jgi:large subunit ribosomal protein L35
VPAPLEDPMPKMKTKRAARKRLKKTATGKLKRAGAWKQHKLEHKHPKRRRKARKNQLVAKSDEAVLRVLVPYL